MRRAAVILSIIVICIPKSEAQVSALQPLPSAAGPDAKTVLIYDREALPFSLLNVRRLVESLISRVDTKVSAHAPGAVTEATLSDADYIVLLGVTSWTDRARIESLIAPLGKPVLAIGRAMKSAPLSEQAIFARGASITKGKAKFVTDLAAAFPVTVRENQDSEILAEAEWQGKRHALAGRTGSRFWFAALPLEKVSGFVFSDVLLDFYGVESVGPSGIICLLDGVRADGSAEALKRMADLLASRNQPFAISVQVPDSEADPRAVHELSLGLQYAQARGGKIFVGLPGNPLWNAEADRPADAAALADATSQLVSASEWAVQNGLSPLGVRLPDSGYSENASTALFPKFRLALGIAQASDATAAATFVPSSLTQLPSGGILLPISLWFQGPEPSAEAIDTARNLLRLRGTILGVSIPAWQTFQQTEEFLGTLFALEAPFLDHVDAPVALTTPEL